MSYQEEAPERAPEAFKPLGRRLQPPPFATDAMGLGNQATNAAARQSGRSMIRSRIDRLRREADGLERLLLSIPEELPREADEALWELASRRG